MQRFCSLVRWSIGRIQKGRRFFLSDSMPQMSESVSDLGRPKLRVIDSDMLRMSARFVSSPGVTSLRLL
ncbi:Hypothetical protein NTJ_09616 [Nesidiocoris tenuis]|uniref:Uncharacterized protein n=1 Tax=Nesidiocoris tenuis TaxID=355587 RepID=A0ABN7AX92_9HEMI|nr:Hypothetical protein NTJ_09616 [Nesidiocoris tenuis]